MVPVPVKVDVLLRLLFLGYSEVIGVIGDCWDSNHQNWPPTNHWCFGRRIAHKKTSIA